MSPDTGYVIGQEKEVGTKGNAPLLAYTYWPLDISFAMVLFLPKTYLPSVEFNIIGLASVAFGLTLLIFIVLLTLQLIIRFKLRLPYSNTEIELLLEKARVRLGYSKIPEIWIYHSTKPILIPLSGFLNTAILISDSAIDDLLASSEHGEVILANALVSLNDRIISTWLPVVMFVPITLLTYPWTGITADMTSTLLLIIYWTLVCIFGASILRPRKEISDPILEEYGIHSDVSRCFVFRKEQPTEQEIAEISNPFFSLFRSLSRKENGLTLMVAVIVSQIVWIFIKNISLTLGFDNFPFVPYLHLTLPFTVSIITLCVIDYYIGKMIQRRRTDDMTISKRNRIQ